MLLYRSSRDTLSTTCRSIHGEIVSYPVTETVHKNSICFVTETPASVEPELLNHARNLAEQAVGCLDGGGVYGFPLFLLIQDIELNGYPCRVELFLLEDDRVLLNEVAPRPHNSGHYTIDGCFTSQFEQHIRAILGWPLGDTSLTVLPSSLVPYGCHRSSTGRTCHHA